MPLVVAGLLPNVPPSLGTSVSTPHPLPFGVRWIASLEICALRVATLPAITTRVTHPFRIHPPIKIRKVALVGSEPRDGAQESRLYCRGYTCAVRGEQITPGFKSQLPGRAISHYGTGPRLFSECLNRRDGAICVDPVFSIGYHYFDRVSYLTTTENMAARGCGRRQVLILEYFSCKSLFLKDFEGSLPVTR